MRNRTKKLIQSFKAINKSGIPGMDNRNKTAKVYRALRTKMGRSEIVSRVNATGQPRHKRS